MQTTTLLLIFAAALLALLLAVYHYYYRVKRRGRLAMVLAFLRFLALFGLMVLLINPKFTKNEYHVEKTNLVILSDNSSSITNFKDQLTALLDKIADNAAISERFDVAYYQFGSALLAQTDSFSFEEKNTDISKSLNAVKEIYSKTNTAVLLLSDGNQTIGTDYEFQGNSLKFPIYPITIGDTTKYEDLSLDQLNVNKYAFLKNKFPVEVYLSYQGDRSINSLFTISVNGKTAYRETVKLSATNSTKIVTTLLEANAVGLKSVTASLQALANERNSANNQKRVAVEVIDEKTNIAIIANILHPDIGALTKSIESNEQRSVVVKKPSAARGELEEIDIFILYQPTASFRPVFDYIKQKKASSFIIGGNKTDWMFLNSVQPEFNVEDGYPNQEIAPVLNPSFSKFDITDISMDDFPPLESDAGPVVVAGDSEALVSMKIRGRDMRTPLLLAKEETSGKKIVLFGENVWKWRMQSFRNDQSFENFDKLIGKLMLYLSNNAAKNRLNIDYEKIYDGNGASKIRATYFDEAFVFDSNASISVRLTGRSSGFSKEIPMLVKKGFYEADLLGVPAGEYDFTVNVAADKRSKSGNFTMMDFDVEQQLLSADYEKLGTLANMTGGALYFPAQIDSLLSELTDLNQFAPTRKGTKNVVSLIDFRILMLLIGLVLALEWGIRKYNGLI